MNKTTKNQLLGIITVAIIVVIVVWYMISGQQYFIVDTLSQITYSPPPGDPPYLTFTFSESLANVKIGTNKLKESVAVLKSFTPTSTSTYISSLLSLLIDGPNAQGPVPFTPDITVDAPNEILCNTLPAGATQLDKPVTITGKGVMQFAVPRSHNASKCAIQ